MRQVSLEGVKGGEDKSLVLTDRATAIPSAGTPIIQVLERNPLRKWALIANSPLNTANFYVRIGSVFVLAPGGSVLINEDMPYSGPVLVQQIDVASATIDITEASVET